MPGPSLIGLTGGIAAGKSEALRILGELGAATISTDAIVHELLGGPEVRERLVERWGADVAPDGEIDRARVGAIVFADPKELTWLESVLHPLVGDRVVQWRRGLTDDVTVAVVEVPLLFEGSMEPIFDRTIAVIADDKRREERASERGTGDLEARNGRQLSQQEKAVRASHVVVNDDAVDDLESQLRELYPRLEGAGE
jgi:dephospho-CoA kinase